MSKEAIQKRPSNKRRGKTQENEQFITAEDIAVKSEYSADDISSLS